MTYAMVHPPGSNNTQSPFRVIVQKTGRQVDWIARYLDQSCVRGLARHTLRRYALDLLHFVRWWADIHKTDAVTEEALTRSTLLDYVRFQAGQEPRAAADTINRRVWVVERALRNLFPDAAAQIAPGFQHFYWRRSALGYGRPRPTLSRLRVKVPQHVAIPLSIDEVGPILGEFPNLARSGHRRADVVARSALLRGVVTESRRPDPGGGADARARQGQQGALAAAGSGSH
jgi:hypothetical protein